MTDGLAENRAADGPHRIVIVGGGAGGLELATRLGDKLGKRGRAEVTLIDTARTHLWKPLLHEIAAGSMDLDDARDRLPGAGALAPLPLPLGEMTGLDRERATVHVAPPPTTRRAARSRRERAFGYDTLVIAIGSLTQRLRHAGRRASTRSRWRRRRRPRRFHRAPGQRLHARPCPGRAGAARAAARRDHRRRRHRRRAGGRAAPHDARASSPTGSTASTPTRTSRSRLIEAAARILPGAARAAVEGDRASCCASSASRCMTGAPRSPRCCADGVRLADGRVIPAELVVWAAGVKAPDFLTDIDGLETNRTNQLVVRADAADHARRRHLRHRRLRRLPPGPANEPAPVPPRAQAAHQQASHLFRQIDRAARGQAAAAVPLPRLRLAGLARASIRTVGSLMGELVGGSLMIEGCSRA